MSDDICAAVKILSIQETLIFLDEQSPYPAVLVDHIDVVAERSQSIDKHSWVITCLSYTLRSVYEYDDWMISHEHFLRPLRTCDSQPLTSILSNPTF